ncbi:MAG: hypothetical protein JSS68_01815 [Actinobacteria bacterium]|nr:hypothetical protein [Actinomycetota bacterium]MBS1884737.1 hypothetical protein [Actinomycetota bacterium]
MLFGLGAAVWGWFGGRTWAIGAIVTGVMASFLSVILLIHLRHEVGEVREVAAVGIGAWRAPIACVGMIVGGFIVPSAPDA